MGEVVGWEVCGGVAVCGAVNGAVLCGVVRGVDVCVVSCTPEALRR